MSVGVRPGECRVTKRYPGGWVSRCWLADTAVAHERDGGHWHRDGDSSWKATKAELRSDGA